MAVNIWDVRRPHVPNTVFDRHQDTTVGIQWKGSDPNVLLSLAKVDVDDLLLAQGPKLLTLRMIS